MNRLMRGGTVIGAEIRNLEGERLGSMTDNILNPEKEDALLKCLQ